MTREEFDNNKNFIVGHTVKVKTTDEINKIIQTEDEDGWRIRYYGELAIKYAGQELISESVDEDFINVYTDPSKSYSTSHIPMKFLDFTKDKRKPSKEAYDLCNKLINSGLYFFIGTSGEIHGSSDYTELTTENVYPILDKDGKDAIHIPDCGRANNALDLEIVQELWKNKTYDASFSTGMSWIKRILHLYTKELVESKSYRY